MIRDYQAIQKTWFTKGQQRIIPIYGKHEGAKLVGFLNYETGEVYVEEHKKYDTEVFRRFLIHVLEHYPEGKIVMILDNAKIHHANFLKDLLNANPRLHLLFRCATILSSLFRHSFLNHSVCPNHLTNVGLMA